MWKVPPILSISYGKKKRVFFSVSYEISFSISFFSISYGKKKKRVFFAMKRIQPITTNQFYSLRRMTIMIMVVMTVMRRRRKKRMKKVRNTLWTGIMILAEVDFKNFS